MSDRFQELKQRYSNPKEIMKCVRYSTIYKAIVEDIPWLIQTIENQKQFQSRLMRDSGNWASTI
jgi:hypothetical protein